MTEISNEQITPILFEFTTGEGLRPVGFFSKKNQPELAKKSSEALEKAMDTIRNMAQRIHSTVEKIENRPSQFQVEFGLKFDAEVGVIIAKAKMESSMIIRLSWENKERVIRK